MKNERLKFLCCIVLILVEIFIIGGVIGGNKALDTDEPNVSSSTSNFNFRKEKVLDSEPILLAASSIQAGPSNFTTSTNGDIVTIKFPNSRNAFTVNYGDNSYSSSLSIVNYGGTYSNGVGKVSVKDGSYYFYAKDLSNGVTYYRGPVNVSGVCKNETKFNQTGTFTVERCYVVDNRGNIKSAVSTSTNIATCASGYKWKEKEAIQTADTCISAGRNMGGLRQRYCKRVFQATCVKESSGGGGTTTPSVPKATLSSLSVSSGSLSPAFKSGTHKYSVMVGSDVSSISVQASTQNGSFVSGYGPRTVNLNYGDNTIKVVVKNSRNVNTTYTITVTRTDGRSGVNTLSNLKVNAGTLSPAFDPSVTNYTVDVDNSVENISIDATLTDSNSKFATGYGPSTYNLEAGPNKLYVKVISERGETNVYSITINRATTPSKCTTDTENLALLKQINLTVDISNLQLDQIEDFDPKQFTYNNIKVPYRVTNLTVEAYVETEGDTFTVEGTDDLEVGENREVKITVKSKECPNYTNVYTLNVQRQPEVTLGDNAELKSLTIANHDEFKFEPNILKYNLYLKKGEEKLDISFEKQQENTQCDITGNEELGYSSEVIVRCVSEDGEDIVEYSITIDGVEKGTNVFFIIILVIIIVLILAYLVLRLLGYRIYFNFGSLFRGASEKVKNIFDN